MRLARTTGCRSFMVAALLATATWAAQSTGDREAAALVEQGKFEQAVPILETILKQSPGDLKARNLLGIALSQMGRPKEAQAHFEMVLKVTPNDPTAHAGMAEIAFAKGRYADTVSHFEKSGGLYLTVPEYTLHYAQSCIGANKPGPSAEALKRLPAGADPHAHFEAGVMLAKLEQFAAAAQHFKLAENGADGPYDAGYNLVLAYIKSKQPALAIEAGERLLGRGFKKAELYNLLSQAYEQSGRTKDAYNALRTATQLDPADEGNYLDLISLCLDHQNWDLSLEIAGIALAKTPNSYRLHLQRGAVLAMRTQYEEAEQEFVAATRAAPEVALPYVSLALVQMQMNRLQEAIGLLRERRKAAPKDYLVNWFLAEALNREGVSPGTPTEEEAVGALRQAVASNAKGEPARVLLGRLLLKRGETDQAIEQLTRALALDPEDSSATYQLAQAYRKKGDSKRAADLFAKVSQEKAEARDQFTQRYLVRIIREGTQ